MGPTYISAFLTAGIVKDELKKMIPFNLHNSGVLYYLYLQIS